MMSHGAIDHRSDSFQWRWFVRSLKLLAVAPTVFAAMALLAWLTGRVLSDRYGWSQWLLWVPTPAAIAVAVAGLMFTLIWPRKRSLVMSWTVCVVALVGYFSLIEHRMLHRSSQQPQGLRIVHWNASYPGRGEEAYIDAVLGAAGDITITTGGGAVPFRPRIWKWNEGTPASKSPFALMTRLPILSSRYLVNEDDIVVVMFLIDTTASLGRPLVLYAVDMPSDLKLSRAELARRARRMMDSADAPLPDVVVGDFNITRGAASLQIMFPKLRHAFDEAGAGFGATFHRGEEGWLLYHIDHVLLARTVQATSYEIIDPGVGRHQMQAVTIIPAVDINDATP